MSSASRIGWPSTSTTWTTGAWASTSPSCSGPSPPCSAGGGRTSLGYPRVGERPPESLHHRRVVPHAYRSSRRLRQPRAQGCILEHAAQGSGEGRRVSLRHDEARLL